MMSLNSGVSENLQIGQNDLKSTVPLESSPIKLRMKAIGSQEQDVAKAAEMPPPPLPVSHPSQKQVMPPPSATGIQNQMSVDEYLEKLKPTKYLIGDLIWAKLTGHPWWPCMVTEDPLLKIHSKITGKGQRMYHCQFFGKDAERSWVSESTTMVFEGREAFLQMVEQTINSAGTKAQRKQACQKYEIKPSKRQAWDLSAIAADHAMKLDLEDRKRVYTFCYRDLPENAYAVSDVSHKENLQSSAAPEPLKSPVKQPQVSAAKRRKESSNSESKSPKKPKYTSLKSLDNQISVDTHKSASDQDPFAFDGTDFLASPPVAQTVVKPKDVTPPQKNRSLSSSSSASKSSTKATPPMYKQSHMKSKVGENQNACNIYEIERLSANSTVRKEGICTVCEKGVNSQVKADLIVCTGPCLNSYHTSCAKISDAAAKSFKCAECSTDRHPCFICKKEEGTTKKCVHRDCGKYYHAACLEAHPLALKEDKGVACPLHVCVSCARGNPLNETASVGKLFKCIKCPSAFHTGDLCIAAGSTILAGFNVICGDHFQREKNNKNHQHINTNWCFRCSLGGTLVCCESCPAAFHKECLPNEKIPENDVWHCSDCRYGMRPRYGDIVWVKLGSFRWWPSEIYHPEHVPLNIQQKAHRNGEFAVHFLGSNDFYWMHRGRVFLYQEGDKGSRESASAKNLDIMYKSALSEAAEAYARLCTIRENKTQEIAKIYDNKPRKYKYIKVNLPIPPVTLNRVDKEQIPNVCECKPTLDNPCGDDEICINRMLYYECHPATCPAGDKCQNQRFQKRQYPKQEPFRTGDERGWGLKAKVDIKKGQFVNEYVGELIDDEECKKRIEKYHAENITSFYMLTLDTNRVIDAGPKGNLARFANHSCQPNMQTQKWLINGNWRIGLFALEDISAGTELTFNYNLVSVGETKIKCLCKAATCSGYIGERIIKQPHVNGDKSVKTKKPKKRPAKVKHDDICFRCGDGGELLMCTRKNCTRAYHLTCLNLDKVPYGKWDCPWHHCDTCGKPASYLCHLCPNSFCAEHQSRFIQIVKSITFCRSHDTAGINDAITRHEQTKGLTTYSNPATPVSTTSSCSTEHSHDLFQSHENKLRL